MADCANLEGNAPALALPAGGMDLAATLLCGQSFVWRPARGGGFAGVAAGRSAMVCTRDGELLVTRADGLPPQPGDEAFWRHYFALDTDYGALCGRFAADPRLAECVAAQPGLRVLNQPFWDTLLCFILSQNNNIGRITAIVGRLRALFGASLPGGEHTFPTPAALAALAEEQLAPLQAGYRARYLIDAARRVAGGEVTEARLRALPDDEARALLCRINGVGPKVADCVLLYGLGRHDVVPMDVWMKRAVAALFPQGLPACAGGHRGIAQQYIFGWARQNL